MELRLKHQPVAFLILSLAGVILPSTSEIPKSFIQDLTEKDFDYFINSSNVRIVFFFARDSQRIQAFFTEYEKSAKHLDTYGIKLGKVNCQLQPIKKFCSSDRIEHHAFGFREGKEKIALPLDTLFDVDSIVSSALHLALIHIVPIIQTYNERKQLEEKCRGKFDIVFTLQRTLGTYEHRVFLESALSFIDTRVFAMTTSESATQGLRKLYQDSDHSINPGYLEWADSETSIWVLHTSERKSEETEVTCYLGDVDLSAIRRFVTDLQLPTWMELGHRDVIHQFERLYGLVLVFYNDVWRESAQECCKKLGKVLRGMVGVVFVNVNLMSLEQLNAFGIVESKICVPCVAFRAKGQAEIIFIEEHAGVEQLILDNIYRQRKVPTVLHEAADPVAELVELQQDDIVAQIVKQSKELLAIAMQEIPALSRQSYHNLKTLPGHVKVVLFYVQWDPVSQTIMPILANVNELLWSNKVDAAVARVDCFDWSDLCDAANITTYPTLRLIGDIVIDYNGFLREAEILFAIYTQVSPNVLSIMEDDVEAFLDFRYFPLYIDDAVESIVIAVFQTIDDIWIDNFTMAAAQMRGQILIGQCWGKAANQVAEKLGTKHSHFLAVIKRKDDFEKMAIKHFTNKEVSSEDMIQFVHRKSMNIFGQVTAVNFAFYNKKNRILAIYFSQNPPATEQWSVIGRVALENELDNVRFGWMDTRDTVTQNVLRSYTDAGIFSKDPPNFIMIDRRNGSVYEYGNKGFDKHSIHQWVSSVASGKQKPTGDQAKGEWKPLHPGFDYLRLLDEEMERQLDYTYDTRKSLQLDSHQLEKGCSNDCQSPQLYRRSHMIMDMNSANDNSHTEL